MNILFYNFGSYTYPDINEYLISHGHLVDTFIYPIKDRLNDTAFCEQFEARLQKGNYDFVFSVNFFPLVAKICNERSLPYLSWSYDSPLSEYLIPFFHFDTNIICLFDYEEVRRFNEKGYNNVHHIPLAVNAKRLEKLLSTEKKNQKYASEISFVGSLYKADLVALMYPMSDYYKGYINALVTAQLPLYGFDIISSAIDDAIIEKVNKDYMNFGQKNISISKTGLVFGIQKELTHIDRVTLIEELSYIAPLDFYSFDKYDFPSSVKSKGTVSYRDELPFVFANSKLNLCPTLRSILSGIPLRALDIMACGGVLFSNYQAELAANYADGKDCIMYSFPEEAIEKAEFYLKNTALLDEIALAGKNKVASSNSYDVIMPTLLNTLNRT